MITVSFAENTKKPWIWLAFVVIVCASLFYGWRYYATYLHPYQLYADLNFTAYGGATPKQMLTKDEVYADAMQLIGHLESVHPMFLEPSQGDYVLAKQEYMRDTAESMTTEQFHLLSMRLLASFHDGHTGVLALSRQRLDANVVWQGDKAILVHSMGEDEVLSIGGVTPAELRKTVQEYYGLENDSHEKKILHDVALSMPILTAAGVVEQSPSKVAVTVLRGGIEYSLLWSVTSRRSGEQNLSSSISARTIEDYVIIEFIGGHFLPNEDLDNALAYLKDRLEEGWSKVILDARNYLGGNSAVGELVLQALGMRPAAYGFVMKHSAELADQRAHISDEYAPTEGFYHKEPSMTPVVRNDDIELYMIVSMRTYSAAKMLAVQISDSQLGKLVGQPPGNYPSAYGDIVLFQLANSRLIGSISCKRHYRPNANLEGERELHMDIPVAEGDDALDIMVYERWR